MLLEAASRDVYREQGISRKVRLKTEWLQLTRCYSCLAGGIFTDIDGGEMGKFDMYEVLNNFFSFVSVCISNSKLRSIPFAVIWSQTSKTRQYSSAEYCPSAD